MNCIQNTYSNYQVKFSEEDCRRCFEEAKEEMGDLEEKFEDVLGNVANWFK